MPGAPRNHDGSSRRAPAGASGASGWSEERAEHELRSLELFGMRFGLDRMRRMMTALGSPERRFESIQVLGTNGKSSTTRMTAAILQRHGLRTGAYLSPHLVSYRERVLIDGRELDAGGVRRIDRPRKRRRRAGQPHARRGRPRHPVRTADGRRPVADGRAGSRRGRRRGRARRALRRHQRARPRRDRAHQRRPRAHALAGADADGHRRGEARRRAAGGGPRAGRGPRARGERRRRADRGREGSARSCAPGSSTRTSSCAPRGDFQRRNFSLARTAAEAYLQRAGPGAR